MTANLSNIWVAKDFWRNFPPHVNTFLFFLHTYSIYFFHLVSLHVYYWVFFFVFLCVCMNLFKLLFVCIINKHKSCHTCKPTRSAVSRVFRPSSCHSFWCVCIFPPHSPAYCPKGSFRSLSRSHPLTSFSSVLLSIFLVLYKHIIFITVIRPDLRRQSDHLPWNQRP